jgi:hypothetical protein
MEARLSIRYSRQDLIAAILANAPTDDVSVSVYRDGNPSNPELLVIVRILDKEQDPEASSWIPYSWAARSGNHLILHIDHATICDIITTHARELVSSACPSADHDSAEVHTSVNGQEIALEVTFDVRTSQAGSQARRERDLRVSRLA